MWIFILYFLPGVGAILYILFSGHFFTGSRRMKEANRSVTSMLKPLLVDQQEYLLENKPKLTNHAIKDFLPLIEMNLGKGDSLLVSTDTVRLYTSGRDFFDDLCNDIQNAKHSIYMEYFIFKSDKIGNKVMDLLCQKSREGVEIKLLYDDLGSLFTRTKFFRKLNMAGGKARPFFLIRIGFPLTLNYRNHRKTTIIDDKIAYTGGVNIGDEYANQSKKIKLNWRDTVIRMTGASVMNMKTNFLIDWYGMDAWYSKAKTSEEISKHYPSEVVSGIKNVISKNMQDKYMTRIFKNGRIPTQIITAGPDEPHKAKIEDALIRMIMSAKKTVYIQTPYFTPDEQFYTALKIASFSGVDVRIMIPRDWDKPYMKAASSEFARQVIGDGVQVYLYPGFIHAKTITVDGNICSIGTTNIDNRSFSLHFEQNVIFYDAGLASECERIFFEDMEISSPAHKNEYDSRPLVVRAWWSFCKLFSELM
jgi:cardiolipin synthase